jgi:hypothetical protein
VGWAEDGIVTAAYTATEGRNGSLIAGCSGPDLRSWRICAEDPDASVESGSYIASSRDRSEYFLGTETDADPGAALYRFRPGQGLSLVRRFPPYKYIFGDAYTRSLGLLVLASNLDLGSRLARLDNGEIFTPEARSAGQAVLGWGAARCRGQWLLFGALSQNYAGPEDGRIMLLSGSRWITTPYLGPPVIQHQLWNGVHYFCTSTGAVFSSRNLIDYTQVFQGEPGRDIRLYLLGWPPILVSAAGVIYRGFEGRSPLRLPQTRFLSLTRLPHRRALAGTWMRQGKPGTYGIVITLDLED